MSDDQQSLGEGSYDDGDQDDYVYYDGSDDEEEESERDKSKGLDLSVSLDTVTILTRAEVEQGFKAQLQRCTETCEVPAAVAAALLREYKFNTQQMTESYFTDPEALLTKLKLSTLPCEVHTGSGQAQQSCFICCDESTGDNFVDMGCNHPACKACFKHVLDDKISEGECFALRCMEPGCGRLADEAFLDYVLGGSNSDSKAKYNRLLLDKFVAENPSLFFCPNREGCDLVLQFPQYRNELDVQCTCGCKFCVGCHEEGHAPTSCKHLRDWKSKDQDESMTATWIKTHTKDCPKCLSSIEKNGGCNHMTCKKCRHEFCWICYQPWKGHQACNGFDAAKLSDTRAELERYTHYWERYSAHVQSLKLEEKHLAEARRRADEMMRSRTSLAACDITDVDYIVKAAKTLTKCRRTLKYTYVHAFYVTDKLEKDLFEHLQANLEKNVEELARLIEKPDHDRMDVINQECVAEKRLANLLSSTAGGSLLDVGLDTSFDSAAKAGAWAAGGGSSAGESPSSSNGGKKKRGSAAAAAAAAGAGGDGSEGTGRNVTRRLTRSDRAGGANSQSQPEPPVAAAAPAPAPAPAARRVDRAPDRLDDAMDEEAQDEQLAAAIALSIHDQEQTELQKAMQASVATS